MHSQQQLPQKVQPLSSAEREAQQFMQRHQYTINYVTTASAPWKHPSRHSPRNIADYCSRLIEALNDTQNSEHEKFVLLVRKYAVAAEFFRKHLANEALGASTPEYFFPIKLGDYREARVAAVLASRTFLEIKKSYQHYLSSLVALGEFRSSNYVDVKREKHVLDRIQLNILLTDPKPPKRFSAQADGAVEDTEDSNNTNADEDEATVAVAKRDELSPASQNALPSSVMHRWSTTTSRSGGVSCSSESLINEIGSLSVLIRRVFPSVMPAVPGAFSESSRELKSCDSHHSFRVDPAAASGRVGSFRTATEHVASFTVDSHAKMRELHVVWLAPQPHAPRLDHLAAAHINTLREESKLAALCGISQAKQEVAYFQHALYNDPSYSAYLALESLVAQTEIPTLEALAYQHDVNGGKVRQKEGANNEDHIWASHSSKLVSQVVVPLHEEYLGRAQRSPAAVKLSQSYSSRLWIEKCLAMELTEEEEALAVAHPTYDQAAFKEEEAELTQRGRTDEWLERKRYFLFRIFASFVVQLPFYHFIAESALNISTRQPLSKATAAIPAALRDGYTWKRVGELDGILIDLNDNEVVACFEIKANPADIGKAALQGTRFGLMLDDAFNKKPLVSSVASAPVQHHEVMVCPALVGSFQQYSRAFYDNVFPLYSRNFRIGFSTPSSRLTRWYMVTNVYVKDWTGTMFANQPNLPVPCEAPVFLLPSQGRARHLIVDAMALLVVQSVGKNQWASLCDVKQATDDYSQVVLPVPRVVNVASAIAAAKKLNGRIYSRSTAEEPSPEDVLTNLQRCNCCANLVWIEKIGNEPKGNTTTSN